VKTRTRLTGGAADHAPSIRLVGGARAAEMGARR
jgi:hypothetical protein